MPIDLICSGCAHRLQVDDHHAGKQARCPNCGVVMPIPSAPTEAAAAPPTSGDSLGMAGRGGAAAGWAGSAASTAANPFGDAAASDSRWFMFSTDGTKYGPVSKNELDGWVRDGRVSPAFRLQQEGQETSRLASEVYPQLAAARGPAVAGANPFAGGQPAAGSANPYAEVPQAYGGMYPGGMTYLKPHRGGLILGLAIGGFLCCCFLSIAAVVMGMSDMKEMDAGVMDPSGRSLTKAGVIVGSIALVLNVLGIGLQVLMQIAQNS